jgi:hypothetical protein
MTQRPHAASAFEGWVRRVRGMLDLPAQVRIAGGRPYALGQSAAPAVEIVVRDRSVLPLLFVFPATPPPPVSFALQAMQQNGLESLRTENLRRHHALTLQCRLQHFEHHAQRMRETIGETNYRIWRVYLAGRAHAFAAGTASLYQIVGQKAGSAATGASRTTAALAAENCALSTDAALYPCGTAGSPYSEHAPNARAPADAAPPRKRAANGESA